MEPVIVNTPITTPQPKKNKGSMMVIIFLVIVAAVVGGYFYLNQTKKPEENKGTIVVEATATPIPTVKPKIDKEAVRIQVINGTGTPGQAGEVVKKLEDAGYSSEKITTGNAEEFDNTSSTVTARAGFEDAAKDIRDLLKPTFDNITVESSTLDADSEYDIVIVTGGKIFETPTPTQAPTGTPTPTTATTLTPTPTATSTPSPTPTPQ